MIRRAFTLIELLVVVAVVAILISILLPALASAREGGRQSVCLANLRNVMIGVQLYLQESNDWLPAAEPPLREFPDPRHWFMNRVLMRQLALDMPLDSNSLPIGPPKHGSILICPSHFEPDTWRDGTRLEFALSYGVNGTWGLGGRPDHLNHRRLVEFARPPDVLAFTDACGVADAPGIVLYKGCPQENFDFRHHGRVNVAWLDGHVSSIVAAKVPFGMQRRHEAFWSTKAPSNTTRRAATTGASDSPAQP